MLYFYDLHYSFIFWIAWHHLESNVILTRRQLSKIIIDTPLIVGTQLWTPNLTYSRMSMIYRLWIAIAIRRVYVFCSSNFHVFLSFFHFSMERHIVTFLIMLILFTRSAILRSCQKMVSQYVALIFFVLYTTVYALSNSTLLSWPIFFVIVISVILTNLDRSDPVSFYRSYLPVIFITSVCQCNS